MYQSRLCLLIASKSVPMHPEPVRTGRVHQPVVVTGDVPPINIAQKIGVIKRMPQPGVAQSAFYICSEVLHGEPPWKLHKLAPIDTQAVTKCGQLTSGRSLNRVLQRSFDIAAFLKLWDTKQQVPASSLGERQSSTDNKTVSGSCDRSILSPCPTGRVSKL